MSEKNTTVKPATLSKNLGKQDKLKKLTKGIFRNYENPGESVRFSSILDKGPAKIYILEDGKECELPLEVIHYINNNCCLEVKRNLIDKETGKEKKSSFERRFAIESYNFD